jgi:hypothetical protein
VDVDPRENLSDTGTAGAVPTRGVSRTSGIGSF